jgi:uncharacterized protein
VVIFIDTSSLAKRYIEETGSPDVDFYFKPENEIAVSPITGIEISSVFNRKLRENSIDERTFRLAMNNFASESVHFHLIQLSEKTVSTSIDCLNKYPMKTLDALQLASAIVCQPDIFMVSDKQLFNFACTELKCECKLI